MNSPKICPTITTGLTVSQFITIATNGGTGMNRTLISLSDYRAARAEKLRAPRVRLTVWMNLTWPTTLTCELGHG